MWKLFISYHELKHPISALQHHCSIFNIFHLIFLSNASDMGWRSQMIDASLYSCNSLTTSGYYWIPMKFPWSTTHRQKSAYLYVYELIYKIGTNVERTLSGSQMMNPTDVSDPLSDPPVPRGGGQFCFLEKCLNNNKIWNWFPWFFPPAPSGAWKFIFQ